MDPFEMIFAIVGISVGYSVFKTLIRHRERVLTQHRGDDGQFRDLLNRLDRMESRMANIETIVLDREKLREFDNL
jgi:hypothetical protein